MAPTVRLIELKWMQELLIIEDAKNKVNDGAMENHFWLHRGWLNDLFTWETNAKGKESSKPSFHSTLHNSGAILSIFFGKFKKKLYLHLWHKNPPLNVIIRPGDMHLNFDHIMSILGFRVAKILIEFGCQTHSTIFYFLIYFLNCMQLFGISVIQSRFLVTNNVCIYTKQHSWCFLWLLWNITFQMSTTKDAFTLSHHFLSS